MRSIPHVEDVATLARTPLLGEMAAEELGFLLARVHVEGWEPGQRVHAEGDPSLGFLLDGRARGTRDGAPPRDLGPGDTFGEIAFARRRADVEVVVATEAVRAAILSRDTFDALAREHPGAAERLMRALAERFAEQLSDKDPGIVSAKAVAQLDTSTGEGREVFRRSAGLALLEAGRRCGAPPLQIGPSWSTGRVVLVQGTAAGAELATSLGASLEALVGEDVPFCEEIWPIERAIERLASQGWTDAAMLLSTSSSPSAALLRCGETHALGPGPLVPSTGVLQGVRVHEHPQGLLLDFGPTVRMALPPRGHSTVAMELRAPRYGSPMSRGQREWLELLGVTGVGPFNAACISGQVKELVFVSEGFHEKHIADIADVIASRKDVRIVAVAGPSASGKTTFIKRLTVQLQVNGIRPRGLSLDDYFVDRHRAPRSDDGRTDFDVIDALDRPLLAEHVTRLLAGENVATAHYDFRSGTSSPQGGAELSLRKDDVLLLEGIHGLDPTLLPPGAAALTFRVFVHPAGFLPFDRLSCLEPSDLRLLRRIVRDRHQRGFPATDNLGRWPTVRRAERLAIFPHQENADAVFDSALVYEPSVLRVYAERYLLEVPHGHAELPAARRLRRLLESFVPIHPDSVPPTSILREFIGGSGFSY
jgi:uridine kinase